SPTDGAAGSWTPPSPCHRPSTCEETDQMDIGTLVTRAGHRFGDRIAVEGPGAGDRRTFAELADRVNRIAGGLLSLGLSPGDRVLDLQSNSTAYLETDLAIRAAGLVRVALNYR